MWPLDIGMLLLRVWLGIVMLSHGVRHARTLEGTASWFAAKGFRPAHRLAQASAVGELTIGAGLVGGLLTAVAAAGFFVFNRPDEGYEYVATLAVAALVVAIVGPGAVSLDALLGLSDRLDAGIGAIVYAAGVALGGLQLVATWSRPRKGSE